jgi:hypothetical protein
MEKPLTSGLKVSFCPQPEQTPIGILSRNAQRRMTLKNPMSITPCLPEQNRQGNVFTWVNSQ